MPRFTLRDLFWLTLVVGMALGWWLDHRGLALKAVRMRQELPAVLLDPQLLLVHAIHLVLWIVLICGLVTALKWLVRGAIEIATTVPPDPYLKEASTIVRQDGQR